jgi:hypothetical protein
MKSNRCHITNPFLSYEGAFKIVSPAPQDSFLSVVRVRAWRRCPSTLMSRLSTRGRRRGRPMRGGRINTMVTTTEGGRREAIATTRADR